MNKRLITVAASLIAVGGITATIAGGLYQSLPIVASQAFCESIGTGITSSGNAPYLQPPGSTQGTGSTICTVTVPAGPPALTGNELVPADTYPASSTTGTVPPGFNPSTVAVPVILLDSGAYQYSVPNATVARFTLVNPVNSLILDGSGTLASVFIQLPGTVNQPALNGQQVHIISAQTITLLNVNAGASVTVDNAPTQLLVGATAASATGLTFVYSAPVSTWFRSQ